MIITLQNNFCLVAPQGPLTAADFSRIAAQVNPVIRSKKKLDGLIIKTRKFPGWESFGDVVAHFQLATRRVIGTKSRRYAHPVRSAGIGSRVSPRPRCQTSKGRLILANWEPRHPGSILCRPSKSWFQSFIAPATIAISTSIVQKARRSRSNGRPNGRKCSKVRY